MFCHASLHRLSAWLLALAIMVAAAPVMGQVAPVPLQLPDINIAGGSLQAVVRQPDGGVVFAGYFTTVNGVARGHIARLLPSGALDMNFNPSADGLVGALAVDSSGAIFMAGRFSVVGGLARTRVAKLSSSGTVDPTWSVNVSLLGAGGVLEALALDGAGGLYLGGGFSHIGVTARANLAKVSASGNGALDMSWNPGSNAGGVISAMRVAADGSVYVAGNFSTIGGLSRNSIAKISSGGVVDAAWNPNLNGFANALAVDSNGAVFVGGMFTSVGSVTRNYIAKLAGSGNGAADAAWNPSANDRLSALAIDGTSIYAGGKFTSIGGQSRPRVARLATGGSGAVDTAWNPSPEDEVRALAVASDGTVYIAGLFESVGYTNRMRLAALPRDVIWRTLTYATSANGTVTGASPQTVADRGTGTEVTAVPNSGYHFAQWSDGSTVNPRTDTNVTANVSVTASFATSFTVTATAGANGTISPATRDVIPGATTTFTVTPAAGYLASVSGCGGSLSGATYTTAAITASCAVTATFTQITYTVMATAGANGSITPASRVVNLGATTTFTVTPNVGYSATVSGCGGSLSGNIYTTGPINANCAISASFPIKVYSLAYAVAANGVIIGTTPQSVTHGSSGTAIMASPNAGYQFVQWSDGSVANPRTDSHVTANVNVSASMAAMASGLALTIDAGRDFVRYGQVLSYAIGLSNNGSTSLNPVSIQLSLPPQLDASATTWTCINTGGGTQCAASGSGALQDSGVVLPAGRSLTWLVSAPVRTNASGADIVTTVTASAGAISANGSNRVVLVIMRNGFDANGDGAQAVGAIPADTCWPATASSLLASEESIVIDDALLATVNVSPPSAQLFETLWAGRGDGIAGFRVDRANLVDGAQLQLVAIAADGSETVSAWIPVDAAATLVLKLANSADGERLWWLDGAANSLVAPLSIPLSSRLQLHAPAASVAQCR